MISLKSEKRRNRLNMERNKRDLWFVLYGIFVTLLIQSIYDGVGSYFGLWVKLVIGLAASGVALALLAIWMIGIKPKENKERNEMKFAILQADIQVWLTACFTLIVLMATCALGAWQIITTPIANLPQPIVSVREPVFYLIAVAGLASGGGTLYSFQKMRGCRKEMEDYSKEGKSTHPINPENRLYF